MLKTRVIVAALLLPPVLVAIWLGGIALKVLVLICMAIASHEYYSFSLEKSSRELNQLVLLTMLPAVAFLFYSYLGLVAFYFLGLIFLSIKAILFIERPIHEPNFEEAFLHQFAGYTYLVAFFSNLIVISNAENSSLYLFWLLATVIGTDSGAFFVGKLMGRNKIAPRISPNKTIEGCIGGTIIGVALGFVTANYLQIEASTFEIIFVSFVASSLCQIGDLFQSLLKRFYGVKDSGKILPGHGGILDRVDGLLFAAPMVYFL